MHQGKEKGEGLSPLPEPLSAGVLTTPTAVVAYSDLAPALADIVTTRRLKGGVVKPLVNNLVALVVGHKHYSLFVLVVGTSHNSKLSRRKPRARAMSWA